MPSRGGDACQTRWKGFDRLAERARLCRTPLEVRTMFPEVGRHEGFHVANLHKELTEEEWAIGEQAQEPGVTFKDLQEEYELTFSKVRTLAYAVRFQTMEAERQAEADAT
jgi:hypothetical protein